MCLLWYLCAFDKFGEYTVVFLKHTLNLGTFFGSRCNCKTSKSHVSVSVYTIVTFPFEEYEG